MTGWLGASGSRVSLKFLAGESRLTLDKGSLGERLELGILKETLKPIFKDVSRRLEWLDLDRSPLPKQALPSLLWPM